MDHFISLPAHGLCPVCLCLARVSPGPEAAQTTRCDRCGEFALSDAAADVIFGHPWPFDRQRLSDAVRAACLLAECACPLIDAIAASALIALATA